MSFQSLQPKRQRRGRSFSFLVILTLAALATMLFSPIAGQHAMAQDDGQQEQQQEEQQEQPVEPTEAPLPTEPLLPTDPPVVNEAPLPTEPSAATEAPTEAMATEAAAPSELIIERHTCPPSYDPEASGADPVTDCPAGPNGVTFTISDADPGTVDQQAATGDAIASAIRFGGLAPGDYTITESAPADTASIFVLGCGGGGIDPGPTFIDGTLAINLPQGAIVTCPWFNVPVGDADPSTPDATPATNTPSRIVIQTSTCPDVKIDPAAGFEAVQEYCGKRVEGVTFQATTADGYDQTDITSTSGTATFEPVPAGEATITGTIPDGYGAPIVFCQSISHSNATFVPEANDLVPVKEGRMTREIETGHDLACQWFNVPETMAATPAAEGTGSIAIVSYACPAGFDVAAVDLNPRVTCPTTPNVEFDIDDTIDDGGSRGVQTDSGGLGTLAELPADTYTIRQFVRNGTTATFVWDCYDTNTTSKRTDPLAMGSVVQVELTEGAAIRCDWFNVVGGTSRVVIATHGCGTSVPAYTLTLDQLRSQCDIDTGAIDFTVVPDYGAYQQTQTASNNPLTLASFTDVPSGYISVVEKLPGGWGTPIVSCQVLGGDGLPVGEARFMDIIVGTMVAFELEPGQVMGCDWFNVTRGPLEVRMIALSCPLDFDAYAYADAPGTLYSHCTAKPAAVEFTTQGGQYLESRRTTADAVATWLDVPSGELQITETVPEGYGPPLVFCEIYITDENNNRHTVQHMVEVGIDATIRQNAPPGQLLQCTWFNVPGATGMVTLATQACPATIDVAAATRLQLEQGCNEAVSIVDYTVASGSFTTTAATALSPYVDFPAVPAGDLTVKQAPVTGYDTAAVYCQEQVQGRVTPQERVAVSADLTIARPLAAGHWLQCEWYLANTPEGTVTVTKWACPEPLPAGQERSYYQQKCTQKRDGVEFTVTGIASSSTQTTTNGGTAQWSGIQPGLVTITETIPEGYGAPIVFCSAPKMNRHFPAANGTIEHELLAGGYLNCDWFNMPIETGHVVVHKGACPAGTTGDHDGAWYASNCAPREGVAFTLAHAAGNIQRTTDGAGEVAWSDLPLGAFSIQERIPSGYENPVVFCFATGETMLTVPQRVQAWGGYLEGELTSEAKHYTCYWYTIPAGANSIAIHTYTCPAGYDPRAHDANPKQDCEAGPNGVTFAVAGAATGLEAETGVAIPHAVRFGGLPNGTYTVTEEVPDEIAATFVWDCAGQRQGEPRPTPLATGPTLKLVLDGNEDVTCHWFNVRDGDPDAGRLTVITYACGTVAYVSEVDCEIKVGGETFDLVRWNGDEWEYAGTKTTGRAGTITWINVDPGEYWLDEHETDWCQLTSEKISDDGNGLNVEQGQETVVKVYTCGAEPGRPGETQAKDPNTGVQSSRENQGFLP